MRIHYVELNSLNTTYDMTEEDRENVLNAYYEEIQAVTDYVEPDRSSYSTTVKIAVTDEQLIQLTISPNIKCDVTNSVEVVVADDLNSVIAKFEVLVHKFEAMTGGTKSMTSYNNKCEVHMPGNMLTMYNNVTYEEDMCTDMLQRLLDDGWRIIAACPQPDQRRPDYILGRYDPE